MASIRQILQTQFKTAIIQALGEEFANTDPLLQPVMAPHFGDFQANFAMSLAKKLGQKPRDIADQVLKHFACQEICKETVVSGPGFINILLTDTFLEKSLQPLINDERLGVDLISAQYPIIVEYGSPNVAKEMHVGHLRSAVIGDALARILRFLGHQVIRQNHVGDWGTQFGMLIQYLIETQQDVTQNHNISDASALYKQAKQRFDADPEFAKRAREQVVALQRGDQKAIQIWQLLVTESERHFQDVYARLGVLLQQTDIRGESFYNSMLADIVKELEANGMATKSEGAITVFLPGFVDRDNKPVPFIIQKSDGGYLYATTDLAAIKYRIHTLKSQRLIYVVDARQSQHFAMLFATAKKANWSNETICLEHAAFGTVLGKDRKPFKTRSGESIQLTMLLDEAVNRAAKVVAEKSNLSAGQREKVAKAVGIGALKYADLSSDKIKDYVFDWEKMLAFEGNTAPYLQNAYVRIHAIFRKGNVDIKSLATAHLHITVAIEHKLAISLLDFPDIIHIVANELAPHRLCAYLYDLAATFHKFYESCPVLVADNPTIRASRLLLCDLSARTLQLGLDLLGIEVIEQM